MEMKEDTQRRGVVQLGKGRRGGGVDMHDAEKILEAIDALKSAIIHADTMLVRLEHILRGDGQEELPLEEPKAKAWSVCDATEHYLNYYHTNKNLMTRSKSNAVMLWQGPRNEGKAGISEKLYLYRQDFLIQGRLKDIGNGKMANSVLDWFVIPRLPHSTYTNGMPFSTRGRAKDSIEQYMHSLI